MLNAGWNEVIWPNACFHPRAEETVSQPLPFPTPSYRSLSFPPCSSVRLSLSVTHTVAILALFCSERLTLEQVQEGKYRPK